jgi:hypothetical protein
MKFLMFAFGLAAVLGVAMVACGPQQSYCKGDSNGQCTISTADPDAGSMPMMDAGLGESVILGDDTGP